MQRLAQSFVSLLLVFLLLPQLAFGCGPFSMEAVFVFTVHPAYPLENFARGEIGVIQPSYARSYLYVAYRHLANAPFTTAEQKALTALWKERLGNEWEAGEETWIKNWLEARKQVPGLPEAPPIEVFRNREKPNEYETFLNCPKDAFDTAVSTLNARLNKYGSDTSSLKTWVEGQDQVFANCREGQHIPPTLPASADQLARADRTYQIAAANFYATKLDDAQQGFEAIAADSSSPWQAIASYLLARTFVRQASLGPEENKFTSLSKAENQLHKVVVDKKLATLHPAASRLLDLVRLRLHPSDRMHELAHTLVSRNPNDHLKQDLWDYTTLLDEVLETGQKPSPAQKLDLETDDLTDWLSTLQGNSSADLDHSLSRWQKEHLTTWLICVLSKLTGNSPQVQEFISEALKIKGGTAAFPSARYHAIRLMIESGKLTEARNLLDQTLKTYRAQFEPSSLNLLLDQRMMLAPNLADFLSHLPRIPAALSWNDDGREIPAEPADVSDQTKALIGKPLYDFDAARVLNQQLPLSILKEAAKDQSLPTHLRQDLVQAAWIRAVLLADYKSADEMVPILRSLVPTLSSALSDFSMTTQGDDKRFSAIYIWLKSPGVEPVVDQGIGRESPLGQQDTYRDNWWCGAAIEKSTEAVEEEEEEITSFTKSGLTSPLFLDESQGQEGAKQWATLRSLGATPNYLSKQVIQWATKNPIDKRVPEALHLVVNSTRYGCTDKETGRWSKAAFDLLHRKYPNTTWAKKTKYWFKE